MTDATVLIDEAPLQDRDLLQRMSLYFDAVDHRLRQGEGWFIFNARSGRSNRIASFIQTRLAEHQPRVSYVLMPWRDFAISAYVTEVGLPELAPSVTENPRRQREFDLATRVTVETWTAVVSSDLLVLVGLKPTARHEADLLDRALERRHRQRLATILLKQDLPLQLDADYGELDPVLVYWDRIFVRMFERRLVAL
jgi:hypothetical protein